MNELIGLTARALRERLRRREVSPIELLDALQARIDEVNPAVNATPTLCFDRARNQAKKTDLASVPLAGLPFAVKDLMTVAGVRTTFGSKAFENNIPEQSDLLIERIESAGGLVYCKTNTPEFGAGANTFNEVFGYTRNPWDTRLSAAGSSGGSAVALATGMAWLATGSDLGGSLRNPASFCSVVGFRPSQGLVPADPGELAFNRSSVDGPMARNVVDVAMFLDVMAGHDPRDPMSLDPPRESFESAALSRHVPPRIAFSKDLGVTPVDDEVAAICHAAVSRFSEFGAVVDDDHPDFSDLQEVFQVDRAFSYAASLGSSLDTYRDIYKPEIVWNVEKGLALTSGEVRNAMIKRSALYARYRHFFDRYDLIATPTTIVPPYPVEQRFVDRVGDHVFSNYIEWCSIAYAFTVVGAPAISIPCGFTKNDLPVGLQIAALPRQDAKVLAAAAALESALGIHEQLPINPKSPS